MAFGERRKAMRRQEGISQEKLAAQTRCIYRGMMGKSCTSEYPVCVPAGVQYRVGSQYAEYPDLRAGMRKNGGRMRAFRRWQRGSKRAFAMSGIAGRRKISAHWMQRILLRSMGCAASCPSAPAQTGPSGGPFSEWIAVAYAPSESWQAFSPCMAENFSYCFLLLWKNPHMLSNSSPVIMI